MSDTDEKEGGIVDFVEMYGGSDSDDADGGDGDEFFTFGGGVIDVDEIFGGIDENLILDGGGTGVDIPGSKVVTIDVEKGTKTTTINFRELDKDGNPFGYIQTSKTVEKIHEPDEEPKLERAGGIITTGEEPEPDEENPIKASEKKPETIVDKNPIRDDGNESEDGGSVHSFHMGVDGGGGGESVCATIVKLLPDLFDPIHDK